MPVAVIRLDVGQAGNKIRAVRKLHLQHPAVPPVADELLRNLGHLCKERALRIAKGILIEMELQFVNRVIG